MQHPRKPLILIEFNELTPSLMFQFMRQGLLPNFQRFYNESQVYTTDAEEEGEDLNPWVQWVTVHSGLSAEQHGIKWLSDGHKLSVKAVWDILSDAGHKVWVCGSMNARYDKPLQGYLVPDPWSSGLTPFPPDEFENYYDFVRDAVQEHTNTKRAAPPGAARRFLAYLLTHGISLGTLAATAWQVLGEKLGKAGPWKRASILDRMQMDVFLHYYRKLRPDFSTFFLNSTAHYQHTYWRNMAPESFAVRPTEAEQRAYGGAIRYGYQQMDRIVGQFLRLAGRDATLLFCTALSQQPYLKAEAAGGRYYYRVIGQKVLVDHLGLREPFDYSPVMSDQALLRFRDAAAAQQAHDLLATYRLPEDAAFFMHLNGDELMIQSNWTRPLAEDVLMTQQGTGKQVPFFKVFYSMDVIKSGFHHPDGMLWIRRPDRAHAVHADKVSIRAIAPQVLEHFGHPVPEYMTPTLAGVA